MMIKTYFAFTILLLFVSFSITAQTSRLEMQKKREKSKETLFVPPVFPEDSMIHLNLKTIEIIQPYKFKNAKQEKKYDQLTEDVKKTYPLALVVGSELRLVNSELDSIYTNPKQRKAYIKWYQDYVRRTYMDSLKTLNVRQGKLLLKLIHRETGHTPYELIKEYRGGMNAIFWQTMAFTFGANLKSDYDPEDDSMIEHIIRRYNAGDFD
jgi:hypothetical protein